MKSQFNYLTLIALFLIYNSCATPYYPVFEVSNTKLTKDTVSEMSNQVYLFFANEKIDFNYKKIAEIEIKNLGTSNDTILNLLKYFAWKEGANALIDISKSTQSNYKNFGDSLNIKSIPYYKALAVKIDKSKLFNDKYGNIVDTSFAAISNKFLKDDKSKKENSESAHHDFAIAACTGTAIGAIIILLSNKNK
ncbi:MAG: hypothetical protein RIQ33_1414 [Bacteroidota bacterium]|jgi:hypothetical protein